jgi:argonaute family protein
MVLYGEVLEEPRLKVEYSSSSVEAKDLKKALRAHGPYDSARFNQDKITCLVLFPNNAQSEKQLLIDGLTSGEGYFKGFKDYFKIPLEFIGEIPYSPGSNITVLLEQIPAKKPDLVYALLPVNRSPLYRQIKSKLLANGIPSQIVIIEKLIDPASRQYLLENIALSSYAKIGGTPWTVSASPEENSLILGVSRAQDSSRNYIVGFVTLFTYDGDFLFLHSKAPVLEWGKYVLGLSELIESAIYEYTEVKGNPDSIVIHLHKKPGPGEIQAVENALQKAAKDIPYALIHLNEYSNFRLFETSDTTYVPPKGLKVSLGSHESLLLLDGKVRGKRNKIGVPSILDVRMDKRSTINVDRFAELVKQIYDFSHINWRGFNSKAIPVTLNYSKLIARMIIEVGIQNWNKNIAEGKLRDKAWFL